NTSLRCSYNRDMDDVSELGVIERYYDTVPRSNATVEEIGPFTLFISQTSFPFYARPRTGESASTHRRGIEVVRRRQVELGVPVAFEWVDELHPELADNATASGLTVERCPLMVHRDTRDLSTPVDVTCRVLAA